MSEAPHSIYDVIIIGAGSVGTPAAFFLAKSGLKVLVLDPYASVGQGSNKRAIGGIRATHSDPAKIRLCLRSLELFSTWRDSFGEDIEWYKGGYSFVAYQEKEEQTLKQLLAIQKSLGLNIDWLDKAQLLKVVPDLNPDGLIGGTLSPDDGSISPLLAIHSFYNQAINFNAEFIFNEPVTEIIISHGKIAGVKTGKAFYSAGVVMNAAGPWANQIGKLAGLNIPVFPESHEAAITESVARFLYPMIVDTRQNEGSTNYYFYQHLTGQILFCLTPNPPIPGFDTRETSSFLPAVARRMVEIMPRLKNVRVRRTWRGLYPMTPDGSPVVGWVDEIPGYLLAVGMCGQGLMLGPGIGELLTRLIHEELTKEDQDTLTFLSPSRQFAGEEMLK
jgi:Glycine/D-amino acid oxidases (deaminating)